MQDNSIDIRQKFILKFSFDEITISDSYYIIMFHSVIQPIHSVNSFINSMKISSENLRLKKWDELKIMNSFEIEGCTHSNWWYGGNDCLEQIKLDGGKCKSLIEIAL